MSVEIPSYVDDGALRDQDDVPLEDFLGDRDRTEITGRGAPFFSGREVEVNAFRSVARKLSRGRPGNATILIEGPPGAGKSALLAQFQEEARAFPPAGQEGRRWLTVPIPGSLAESPSAIQAAVDEAIAAQLAQDLSASMEDEGTDDGTRQRFEALFGGDAVWRQRGFNTRAFLRHGLDRGFGVMGFKLGGGAGRHAESIQALYQRRAAEWSNWQVVLLIDEAQRISDQGPGGIKGTLEALHLGFMRAPISFCAFGLPGTSSALRDAGVSRATVEYDLDLDGLDDDASQMAVRRCFGQYGVTNGAKWESAILARSANWPQHLATYLTSALATLRQSAETPDTMGDARRSSLTKAMQAGDKSRESYYAKRMERLNQSDERHERYAQALISWLTSQPAPPSKMDAIDFLEGAQFNLQPDKVNDFLADAKQAGLIHWKGKSPLKLPIPSFASYLMGDALPPLPNVPAARSKHE